MKTLWIYFLASLALIGMGLSRPAQANDLQKACGEMYGRLQTIKGAALGRRDGEFTDWHLSLYEYHVAGGTHYRGCIITLTGNDKEVSGDWYPETLFGPTDATGDLYKEGWRIDDSHDADGMDGTAFKTYKGDIDCFFVGNWDGGEDDNPKYIPSPLFEVEVACGKKVK